MFFPGFSYTLVELPTKSVQAKNSRSGAVVASRVVFAQTFASRAVGLMGRKSMESGEGLWIEPCSSIHTCFMRFPIDVLFLDEGRSVVRVIDRLKPWRFSPIVWKAKSVLELKGGSLQGSVRPGDVLEFK